MNINKITQEIDLIDLVKSMVHKPLRIQQENDVFVVNYDGLTHKSLNLNESLLILKSKSSRNQK